MNPCSIKPHDCLEECRQSIKTQGLTEKNLIDYATERVSGLRDCLQQLPKSVPANSFIRWNEVKQTIHNEGNGCKQIYYAVALHEYIKSLKREENDGTRQLIYESLNDLNQSLKDYLFTSAKIDSLKLLSSESLDSGLNCFKENLREVYKDSKSLLFPLGWMFSETDTGHLILVKIQELNNSDSTKVKVQIFNPNKNNPHSNIITLSSSQELPELKKRCIDLLSYQVPEKVNLAFKKVNPRDRILTITSIIYKTLGENSEVITQTQEENSFLEPLLENQKKNCVDTAFKTLVYASILEKGLKNNFSKNQLEELKNATDRIFDGFTRYMDEKTEETRD